MVFFHADFGVQVHGVMGLSTKGQSETPRPTFSDHVLRLEISGPDQEHFSVIDIPGIFRSTTEGLTTKSDIQMVRTMVKSYMKNPRSVILAVIPANVDVPKQEILEMAAEVNPHQDRTLGVLTKPDLVDDGAEASVVELLEGRVRPTKLGWRVTRNPGQNQLSDKEVDRDFIETNFFRTEKPWNSLDEGLVGIDALRLRLNETLSSVVKREFPAVSRAFRKDSTLTVPVTDP